GGTAVLVLVGVAVACVAGATLVAVGVLDDVAEAVGASAVAVGVEVLVGELVLVGVATVLVGVAVADDATGDVERLRTAMPYPGKFSCTGCAGSSVRLAGADA